MEKHSRLSKSLWILALIFSGLFMYTAFQKTTNQAMFLKTLNASGMFNKDFQQVIMYGVIIIEFSIALLLILRRSYGFLAAMLLMLVFSIYIWVLQNHYYYSPCGCGGLFNQLPYKEHLTYNLILLFVLFSATVTDSFFLNKKL